MQAVKLAFSQCPSFDIVVPAILEHGPLVRQHCAYATSVHALLCLSGLRRGFGVASLTLVAALLLI